MNEARGIVYLSLLAVTLCLTLIFKSFLDNLAVAGTLSSDTVKISPFQKSGYFAGGIREPGDFRRRTGRRRLGSSGCDDDREPLPSGKTDKFSSGNISKISVCSQQMAAGCFESCGDCLPVCLGGRVLYAGTGYGKWNN